jgi:hypothetical protein
MRLSANAPRTFVCKAFSSTLFLKSQCASAPMHLGLFSLGESRKHLFVSMRLSANAPRTNKKFCLREGNMQSQCASAPMHLGQIFRSLLELLSPSQCASAPMHLGPGSQCILFVIHTVSMRLSANAPRTPDGSSGVRMVPVQRHDVKGWLRPHRRLSSPRRPQWEDDFAQLVVGNPPTTQKC